jgi:hypothetical protein
MTLFLRVLTATVLFLFFFVLLSLGALVLGGAVAGVIHAGELNAQGFSEGYAAGQEAGARFGAAYGGIIFLLSAVASLVISGWLSFSNILPWCRSKPRSSPPDLPTT